MSNAVPVVEIKDCTFGYPRTPVIEAVSLEIFEKDFLAILGPNGGGKTTLLKLILGFERPQSGSVRVFGQDPSLARPRIGYVPQNAHLSRDFPIRVREAVLMGRMHGGSLGPWSSAHDREAAERALQAVDLVDLKRRRINSLSGGQHQRVLVARALAGDPQLLVLDEPTASVDTKAEQGIFDLFKRLNQTITIVLVTHDLGFISDYVNRVACLNRQLVCHEQGQVTPAMIEQMYGKTFSMLQHDHRKHRMSEEPHD